MYSSAHEHHLDYCDLFRWTARIVGAVLFAGWLALVILELVESRLGTLSAESCYQAAALAVVFLGYLLGWRDEVLGGLFAFLGVAIYILVIVLTVSGPPWEATLLAVPGGLYLLAWYFDERSVRAKPRWR